MFTVLLYVASAIVVLGVLIFVHELGHFTVAKLSNVAVLRFSLGFGPKIFGRRVGETEYVVSAVPLGGYVKMLGEEANDEESAVSGLAASRSFAAQSLGKRMAIVLAGPLSNLGFSWLCLVVVLLGWGVTDFTNEPVIGSVSPELPAARAGLKPGDRVLEIDGRKIETWDGSLTPKIRASRGEPMRFRVERDGETLQLEITPERHTLKNLFGEEEGEAYRIGIGPETVTKSVPVVKAPAVAAVQVAQLSTLIVVSIGKMISGSVSAREIGGPITIARVAGEKAQGGLRALLEFMAFIGVNLGILNLLPIPVLDGGHLLFLLFEAVLRRPLEGRAREWAQQVGLFLLVGLMLFAVYNDISRWVSGS